MRIRSLVGALLAGLGLLANSVSAAPDPGLAAFGSSAELSAFLTAHARQQPDPVLCPPDAPDCDERASIDEVVVTGSRVASAPSITNNQEAGVDEGDVVKARGDTLVILRRGRLFTASTADGGLRPVDSINAFPPGVDASDDWYDEMLVSGNRVIVIGYSYGRGGTEINRFLMDAAGRLTFEDSHHLSSNDYYSSRNYASRLVGGELVVYSPVNASSDNPLEDMPTLDRWRPGADGREAEGVRIVAAQDVYRAPGMDKPGAVAETIHTVIRCDLGASKLTCGATAILGPESRSFYVASTAVYVWMSGEERPNEAMEAWLYRIPLNGGRPQAAATRGTPIDQFSFHEDAEAARIDVMVVSDGEGDGMWGAEAARGNAALLRLPFTRFGEGEDQPVDDDYRILPALTDGGSARNRFVGSHLLYASSVHNQQSHDDHVTPHNEGLLTVVPLNGDPLVRFLVPDGIGRIEEMGPDALVVSGDDDVFFTTVELQTPRPTIGDQFIMVGSEETESRSHAFFYQPDASSADGSRGLLGLPVTRPSSSPDAPGARQTVETIAYLRRDAGGRLGDVGSLNAGPVAEVVDDGCQASCHDWYGDARPIFLAGRVFALLGYEVIEGRERAGRIREQRRIDLTPPTPEGPRPYYLD